VNGLWRGVGVALVTLFDDGGEVDAAATGAHAARLVDDGVRAVVVAGTTGEADALTDDERARLVRAVKRACPDVPVVAGASGAWHGEARRRAAQAVSAGADALLVAPPRRPTGVAGYYRAVREAAAGVPVLAYHYPGVAGGEVPVDALPGLPVDGIKDSTGDPERLLRTLAAWTGRTYTGSSALLTYAGGLGAAGAILALANAVPADCVAAFDGDATAQRRLLPAHLAARTRFPHGLKELVARHYGTSVAARMG
jgi:4-hydroxy-tetrahydrodipicolinate synthase